MPALFLADPLNTSALFGAGLLGMALGVVLSTRSARPHFKWFVAWAALACAMGMAGAAQSAGPYNDARSALLLHMIIGGVSTCATLVSNACATLLMVVAGRSLLGLLKGSLHGMRKLAR